MGESGVKFSQENGGSGVMLRAGFQSCSNLLTRQTKNFRLFRHFMRRFSRSLSILFFCLAVSSTALHAQWLVYELQFKEEAGSVNFSFYTGAYVVAPINGGAASVVFTTEEGGNYYAASENSMRYYTAVNQGIRQAVLSAFSINGTAQAFYMAAGALNTSIGYVENGMNRTTTVAASLAGALLASDDESFQTPGADGSRGMIGRASISGVLRHDLTQIVNGAAITMHDAVGSITGLLQQYGYQPDEGEVGAPSAAGDAIQQPAEQPAETAPAPAVETSAAPQMREPEDDDISALFGGSPNLAAARSLPPPSTADVVDPSLFPAGRLKEE